MLVHGWNNVKHVILYENAVLGLSTLKNVEWYPTMTKYGRVGGFGRLESF